MNIDQKERTIAALSISMKHVYDEKTLFENRVIELQKRINICNSTYNKLSEIRAAIQESKD